MNRVILSLAGALLVLAVVVAVRSAVDEPSLADDPGSPDRAGHRDQMVADSQRQTDTPTKSRQRKDGAGGPRSKASMLVNEIERCFCDRGAVSITRAVYSADGEEVTGDGTGARQTAPSGGQWSISGYTVDDGLDVLTRLNTREGIAQVFARIHDDTGDEAFSTESPDHGVSVNLLVSENTRNSADVQGQLDDATSFPLVFRLTVSRR